MLSQIAQKKIKFKLKSIYRYHLSEIEISNYCEEIIKIINQFNKRKNKKKKINFRKNFNSNLLWR